MANVLKTPKSTREEENVFTWSYAIEEGASQDEIARWLQFAEIALKHDLKYEEAA